MKASTGSRLISSAAALAAAISVTACAAARPEGNAGLKVVTPLKPAAAVCLANEDPSALRKILGNDEMIRKAR